MCIFCVIELKKMLNSRFVCAVIHTGLQRRKFVLILFRIVFWIDKNRKSDIQDKFLITIFCPSIVSYGNNRRSSTSEYFPIKICSLRLYDRVIKCHDTRADMSAMPSMSGPLNDIIQGTYSKFIHMCQLTSKCLRVKYVRTV